MPQTTIRRWPRLSHLIFVAGCASASLTLTNFNKIPDEVTSKACREAYNTPLENCKVDDFTHNNVCSSKCRESISEVEDIIEKKCATVTVNDSNSLLYRAQKGQLEDVLCLSDGNSNNNDDASTTTVQAVTSNANKNQVMETSTITTQTTTAATSSETAQTTSLVLAGDKSTGILESAVSSSAKSTETSSSGRGGDPFANNTGAGANLVVGYATLVMSALVCMVVVM